MRHPGLLVRSRILRSQRVILKNTCFRNFISNLVIFSAVLGPKLGMRAMVQCRFSWGYYAAALPSVLNVFSAQSYLILNSIIGGQALAAVSSNLNDTLGIVIIGLISFAVRFCE